jgi:hypothetical protein
MKLSYPQQLVKFIPLLVHPFIHDRRIFMVILVRLVYLSLLSEGCRLQLILMAANDTLINKLKLRLLLLPAEPVLKPDTLVHMEHMEAISMDVDKRNRSFRKNKLFSIELLLLCQSKMRT